MDAKAPTCTKAWILTDSTGVQDLKLREIDLPKLQASDVLVNFKASALNYRDVVMAKGLYPAPWRKGVVAGSDGAAEVMAVGPQVTEFKAGDRVVTVFFQGLTSGNLTPQTMQTNLGGMIDGTFRQYGVFPQQGLVLMPETLSWQEGGSLSCAAPTAWNALYGERTIGAGDTILVQGSGGVSLFALQFAVAAGATVIATTSSSKKAQFLKDLGAKHVVNYEDDSEWGTTVKKLTRNGEGVDNIIEVGGPSTLRQSLNCIKMGGTISLIGFLGGFGAPDVPSMMEVMMYNCTVRGTAVGSREQFREMNKTIDKKSIKPVLDRAAFGFEDVGFAYEHLWNRKNVGKVIISIG